MIWISAVPPSWLWVTSYSTLGLVISTCLYFVYQKLVTKSFAKQMLVSIVSAIVLGMLWRVLFNTIEYHILESANNQFKFWGYFHNGKSSVMQLLIWISAVWLIHYYHQVQKHREFRQLAELEKQASQLKMLQYQISPHFLFNVLGNMDTLLLKNRSRDARKMLTQLTRFLRSSLSTTETHYTDLGQELALISSYLDIEKVRLGNRLNLKINLDDDSKSTSLPTGLLVPLVENALKHGAIATSSGGFLKIESRIVENDCEIRLSNDLKVKDSKNNEGQEGFGLGIKNTRQRLEHFYHGKANMRTRTMDNIYELTLRVPV